MRVLKFGGSSLISTGISVILEQIQKDEEKKLIVVSASGKTTNHLYRIINLNNPWDNIAKIEEYHRNLCLEINIDPYCINPYIEKLKNKINSYISDPSIDMTQTKIEIISYGEILSSVILHQFLNTREIKTNLLNARQFIINDQKSSTIDNKTLKIGGQFYVKIDKLEKMICQTCITQGFIASTSDDKFCVMTRSGSDTTASLIANSVKASSLEIWTDVNGLYTADPRHFKKAKLIETISYDLCQEISTMGSHVIHPLAIYPCREKNVPIFIKNTFKPQEKGTIICNKESNIDAICLLHNVCVIKICSLSMWQQYGFAGNIFKVFADKEIDLDIITSSSVSITVTINDDKEEKIKNAISLLEKDYKVTTFFNCVCVTLVTQNIYDNKVMQIIEKTKNEAKLIHPSTNGKSISVVINKDSDIDKEVFLC